MDAVSLVQPRSTPQRMPPPFASSPDVVVLGQSPTPPGIYKPVLPLAAGRSVNSVRNLVSGLDIEGATSVLNSGPARAGIGVLAGVGGALQTGKGVRELHRGDVTNGTADVGSGSMNISGAALVLLACPAAPIAFGLASAFDGTRDILVGRKHHDGERQTVGVTKDIGAALLLTGGTLAATGLAAPVGLALAGIGGLISFGGTLLQNRHAIARFFARHTPSGGH